MCIYVSADDILSFYVCRLLSVFRHFSLLLFIVCVAVLVNGKLKLKFEHNTHNVHVHVHVCSFGVYYTTVAAL